MENLRISTITGIGSFSCDISLDDLYTQLGIDETIKLIKYKDQPYKGDIELSKKKKKKSFYNQLTILVYYNDKIVNVKVFNNGKIQMTGLKETSVCGEILEVLRTKMVKYKLIPTISDISINSSEIVLINSDFSIGYKINPDILYREILNKGLFVTYEPCIYPGVNIKYYNKEDVNTGGICNCENPCNGKGKNGDCKRITIAVFNSGNIIITGAKRKEELVICYNFIKNTIDENRELLELK
jgi:TATA-box binding protein (TBP) (component of TFIID and TFIIIB)